MQNGDFEAAASGPGVAVIDDLGGSGTVYTVDLGGGLAHINDAGRTQLRMYFALDDNDDRGNDYSGFYPTNNADSSRHPRLIVTYRE